MPRPSAKPIGQLAGLRAVPARSPIPAAPQKADLAVQADPMTIDETKTRLEALKDRFRADSWAAAQAAAAEPDNHDHVLAMVKLKVDIEAIDFALACRPAA
jgi:hypothetical protein